MLMVISFPVPHADGSVNYNHKKGACPSGHGPFFVCNRLNQDFRICRMITPFNLIFTNFLGYTYE